MKAQRDSKTSKQEERKSGSKRKNLFQVFFEKALGPPESPKRNKMKQKNSESSDKAVVPRVRYNPVLALLGSEPKGVDGEKEILALPNTILKIDHNHLALNKVLENRELLTQSQIDYEDIKNLISLDYDKGWQYRIILEGGLLLCQLREIHKERNSLVKHLKTFIRKAVKSKHDNIESLKELVDNLIPTETMHMQGEGNYPNPVIPILVDTLYNDLRKVKEAYQTARDQAFLYEE